ncbi:hypothetical protein [Nocardia sp. NPDC057440]
MDELGHRIRLLFDHAAEPAIVRIGLAFVGHAFKPRREFVER